MKVHSRYQYIDLTEDVPEDMALMVGDMKDRLTALPSELLHMIFDFLLVRHLPDKAFFVPERSGKSKCFHPLDMVSATSKDLRVQVNDWAMHFLLQYKGITPEKQPKGRQKNEMFNALRGRNGLLTWSNLHCIFCGKKTSRLAIMMNGFHCCRVCDSEEWPEKITKTNAQGEYDLREYQLLPNRHRDSLQIKKLRDKWPQGLPKIPYGTYISCGVQTTMFLRKDVEWLATQYYPDLEGHLARRKAMKEKRAQRRAEKKAAKDGCAAGSLADEPQYIDEDED